MTGQSEESPDEWLTMQQFADHYGVSTRTVALWVACEPTMRIRRVGPSCRVIRIHRSELDRGRDGVVLR